MPEIFADTKIDYVAENIYRKANGVLGCIVYDVSAPTAESAMFESDALAIRHFGWPTLWIDFVAIVPVTAQAGTGFHQPERLYSNDRQGERIYFETESAIRERGTVSPYMHDWMSKIIQTYDQRPDKRRLGHLIEMLMFPVA